MIHKKKEKKREKKKEKKKKKKEKKEKTSDAGSQYHCGRVGRGIQPPSTPQPTSNTQTYTKSIENARFPTFQLDHHDGRTNGPTDGRTNGRTDQRTDQRTDKASYRVACPQLKIQTCEKRTRRGSISQRDGTNYTKTTF